MSNELSNIYKDPPSLDKNLPPIIYKKNGGTDGKDACVFTIPFYHNINKPLEGEYSLAIRVTGVTGNDMARRWFINISPSEIKNNTIKCTVNTIDNYQLLDKTFYKISLAYTPKTNNTDFINYYWSTSGIAKCMNEDNFECIIEDLDDDQTVYNPCYNRFFTGRFISLDRAETIINYKFSIYEGESKSLQYCTEDELFANIFYTTGVLLHSDYNTSRSEIEKGTSNSSLNSDSNKPLLTCIDILELTKVLTFNQSYCIQYEVETVNGLHLKSPLYNLIDNNLMRPEIQGFLDVSLNYSEGYIDVKLVSNSFLNGAIPVSASGDFSLFKSSAENNYTNWIELLSFTLNDQIPNIDLYKDFFVTQGVKYKYAIQVKGKKNTDGRIFLPSAYLKSAEIQADFEDAFLIDKDHQLKLRFNPKITGFKATKLEGKIDTIGGRFPFLTRNNSVNYKTFTISSLISVLSDEQQLFKTQKNHLDNFEFNAMTSLSTNNFQIERDFKLEVIEWLSNGKPKVFKSPGEGNYIIQLQGVNLTPNDTVGRMLHSFSANAIEIADYKLESLYKYNFLEKEKLLFTGEAVQSYSLRNILPYIKNDDSTHFNYYVLQEISPDVLEFYYIINTSHITIQSLQFTNLPLNSKIEMLEKIDLTATDYEKSQYYYLDQDLGIFVLDESNTYTINRVYYYLYGQTYYIGQNNFLLINDEGYKPTEENYLIISNISSRESIYYSTVDIKYNPKHKKNYKNLLQCTTSFYPFDEIVGDNNQYLIGKQFFDPSPEAAGILEERTKQPNMSVVHCVMKIPKIVLRCKNIYKNFEQAYYYNKTTNRYYQNYDFGTRIFDKEITSTDLSTHYFYYVIDPTKTDNEYVCFLNSENKIIIIPIEDVDMTIRINNNIINIAKDKRFRENNNIFEFNDLDNLSVLKIGNGLIADLCYYRADGLYDKFE